MLFIPSHCQKEYKFSLTNHILCRFSKPSYAYPQYCVLDVKITGKCSDYVKFRGAFTPGLFCFVPKEMICSEICIFPLGRVVFTMHYCKAGLSIQTRRAFLNVLASLHAPHACWSRFALWGIIMTVTTTKWLMQRKVWNALWTFGQISAFPKCWTPDTKTLKFLKLEVSAQMRQDSNT